MFGGGHEEHRVGAASSWLPSSSLHSRERRWRVPAKVIYAGSLRMPLPTARLPLVSTAACTWTAPLTDAVAQGTPSGQRREG